MMGKARQLGAISTVLAFALCSMAVGQVVLKDTGRKLDSSLRVGSGGYNAPITSVRRFDSQLLINRQSTGLSSFRGGVPYKAANELRLDLPSAGLGDFRRQSIGIGQVLRGLTIGGSPYYERTSTTLSIPAIRRGLNLPGSSVPQTSYPSATSVARTRRLDYRVAYRQPVGVSPPGQLLRTTRTPGVIPFRPVTVARISANEFVGLSGFVLVDPKRMKEQDELARQLAKPSDRLDVRIETRIDAARTTIEPFARPEELPTPAEPLAPEPNAPVEPPPIDLPAEEAPQPGEPENEDVYIDLLKALFNQRRAGGTGRKTPAETTITRRLKVSPAPRPEAEHGNMIEAAPPGLPVIIHGLAGTSQDLFNRRMTRAQERMNKGDFFGAGSDFEFAAMLNRTNPLPQIGAAISRFAGGEFLSAGMAIRYALKLQPALVETRFDLPSILSAEVIYREIANADTRLAQGEADARLALTATFVYQNLGHATKARVAARKLRKYAKDDKIFAGYADYVLSHGRATSPAMKSIPATMPAK